MLRIMMLLAKARNDVIFAHYAVRRNIIHEVYITAVGNIICPQGQTSFSVNAPLRALRYSGGFGFLFSSARGAAAALFAYIALFYTLAVAREHFVSCYVEGALCAPGVVEVLVQLECQHHIPVSLTGKDEGVALPF